ncbi:MAG TPA: DUF4388 domain-containing protein [Ktedonobacteraceae bacterium]|nr:DUF4388 domain-containing protein [Ktedonobacteraceae bacterium]
MTITHAISTERLVNVLQSIALKQRTGCLNVERERPQRGPEYPQEAEKGNIFFERGDTVFALTGQESGETALFRMLKWKHVSYTFIEGMRYTSEQHISDSLSQQVVQSPSVSHPSQTAQSFDILRLSSIKAAEGRQTPPLGIPVLSETMKARQMPVEMVETQLLPVMNLASVPSPTPPEMALPGTPSVQGAMFAQWNTWDTGKHEQVTQGRRASHEGYDDHTIQMGIASIFRSLPHATTPIILSRLERRERVVLLLLNGKRSLRDVAILVHHSEVDVARTLVRLLKQGYIEYIEHSGAE